MLSVSKLNNNRIRVNQHNTELGIRKDNAKEIIEAVALTLAPKEYQTEEKTIDEQLAIMDREKKEKKLLDYQLKNNPQNVSTFLANKYADGNFNVAVKDRYDNSEERKKSGLTFDYHVYLPMEKRYDTQRGHNKYVLSEKITDGRTGDSYIYHIPLYIDSSGEVPVFITDYGEVIDDPNSKGLKWALGELRSAIDSGRFGVDPLAESILTQFGFVENGRIIHDITGDVLVEKYLKSISPPEKKVEAVQYLESSLLKNGSDDETVVQHDAVPTVPVVEQAKLSKNKLKKQQKEKQKQENIEDLKKAMEADGVNIDATSESSSSLDTPVAKEPVEEPIIQESIETGKHIKIKPDEYKGKTIADIAKMNAVPVIEYIQPKRSDNSSPKQLDVVLGNTVYHIVLRTGYRGKGSALTDFTDTIDKYHKRVKKNVSEGILNETYFSKELTTLLQKKGFTSLTKGEVPPLIIVGFNRGKSL